jgi:2-(1,2-epoxy-1,2-dihydrophenyl)acetyl-CoA isomerase
MTLYTELLSNGASDQRRLVHVERDQTRAVLTLCDPERLNPLSAGLMVQLQAHVMDLTADPSLRTIVIINALLNDPRVAASQASPQPSTPPGTAPIQSWHKAP